MVFVLIFLFASACASPTEPATATIAVSPSALASETPTATATVTAILPSLTPTLVSFEGTLTIKVNVRSGPGMTFSSLGQLNAGEIVKILSKNEAGSWYQILYPSVSQGRGWVAAQYVQLAAGVQIPLDATATPAGPTGVVSQRLNVRSGPGTTFNSLGMLEPKVTVSLTGKNSTASWFQIVYPAGPGGRGWVTAQYIQTDVASGLPVLDDYGTPLPTSQAGTPYGPLMTPTPTIGPAMADGDSRAAPAMQVTFTALGTRQFTYSSQVSAPEGDPEDWVEFTPYAAIGTEADLFFSLACSGNGSLVVELWQGDSVVPGWGPLSCGDQGKSLPLAAGQPYELRLAPAPGEGLRLVNYVLTVENR